jgi:uncharacterized membrane protein (DUF373 family)
VAEKEHITVPRVRQFVVQGLSSVEDVVYVGLGILLAMAAFSLLVKALHAFATEALAGSVGANVVGLLEQILLTLLVIELLYTVRVSFREHGLVAEPFLVVALIAVIRRILILTAEVPKLPEAGEPVFRHAILELSLLTVMVLVLVGSLIMLQRQVKTKIA